MTFDPYTYIFFLYLCTLVTKRGGFRNNPPPFFPPDPIASQKKKMMTTIFLAVSPYEVYGKWDPKVQRKLMDVHVRHVIEDRFHIIKLDGPVTNDRRQYCDPTHWTHAEYIEALQDTFYNACEKTNARGMLMYQTVKEALHMCYEIHERRIGPSAKTHLSYFTMDLTEDMHEEDAKVVKKATRAQYYAKDLLHITGDDSLYVQLHGYPERRRKKEAMREEHGGLLVVHPCHHLRMM